MKIDAVFTDNVEATCYRQVSTSFVMQVPRCTTRVENTCSLPFHIIGFQRCCSTLRPLLQRRGHSVLTKYRLGLGWSIWTAPNWQSGRKQIIPTYIDLFCGNMLTKHCGVTS